MNANGKNNTSRRIPVFQPVNVTFIGHPKAALEAAYGNSSASFNQIHEAWLHTLAIAKDMGKREIMDPKSEIAQAVEYGLACVPHGLDRGSLSAWLVKFTPLRPKFKANGHYERLGFARSPKWDLVGAALEFWGDTDPERTRAYTAPSIPKTIEGTLKKLARLVALGDMTSDEIADAINAAASNPKTLATALEQYAISDGVVAWAASALEQRKAAERAKRLSAN